MEITKTERGFGKAEFTDSYGETCSIQLSSSADQPKIWIGVDKPKLTIFRDSTKGAYDVIEMPENYMVSTHMHLTQKMVKELLPLLKNFAKTGEL